MNGVRDASVGSNNCPEEFPVINSCNLAPASTAMTFPELSPVSAFEELSTNTPQGIDYHKTGQQSNLAPSTLHKTRKESRRRAKPTERCRKHFARRNISDVHYFILEQERQDVNIGQKIWRTRHLIQDDNTFKQPNGFVYIFIKDPSMQLFCGLIRLLKRITWNSYEVEWIFQKKIPFFVLRHICLSDNGRSVVHCRGLQEISEETGETIRSAMRRFLKS